MIFTTRCCKVIVAARILKYKSCTTRFSSYFKRGGVCVKKFFFGTTSSDEIGPHPPKLISTIDRGLFDMELAMHHDLIVNSLMKVDDTSEIDIISSFIDENQNKRRKIVAKRKCKDDEARVDEEPAKKVPDKKCDGFFYDDGHQIHSWHMDDITENLADDFDGSLSGLGNELANGVTEALLSLSSLPSFKQEIPSPSDVTMVATNHTNPYVLDVGPTANTQRKSVDKPDDKHANHVAKPDLLSNMSMNSYFNGGNNSLSSDSDPCEFVPTHDLNRFQYVLAAATSIATKLDEETLTYLNQGQSYEIKLKKLGELTIVKGKILKSIVGVCFHERRMQYSEKEQLMQWQNSHVGERMLDVDVPLSYGVMNLTPLSINTISFEWNPTIPVSVYIKVNCISTEFTMNKHGGEKGVPFRIHIETYLVDNDPASQDKAMQVGNFGKRLHSAACQIKVFKLKGADRKHKQDREKIRKRPIVEQEKYQKSCECTILNELTFDSLLTPAVASTNANGNPLAIEQAPFTEATVARRVRTFNRSTSNSPVNERRNRSNPFNKDLSPDADNEETLEWLHLHRFNTFLTQFANFSGKDMYLLSQDHLTNICGYPEGLRLFNALHARPLLTLYFGTEPDNYVDEINFHTLTSAELKWNLSAYLNVTETEIARFFVVRSPSVRVSVTDDVVRNFRPESIFIVEMVHDHDGYDVLLKLHVA